MFSHFFKNARNFRITGGSFVQVQGDQINNITTIVQAKEKERTELDEYFEVKRGAIYRLRKKWSYKYPRRWDDGRRWGWEQRLPRADRTIHAAELVDRPGKVFTVVEYTGPEAKKAFEDDFALLIRNLTFNAVQMYGYNLSSLPSILLYNELVPAAHLNAGTIGRVYLYSLCMQLGCKDEELWLDPGRGVFCHGLQGPIPKQLSIWSFGNEELPLNAELIQEDVLLRFLASINSRQVDKVIIMGVASSGAFGFDVPERVLSRLTVVSTLTNAPIAIANSFWESEDKSLSDRNLLGNGMTSSSTMTPRWLATLQTLTPVDEYNNQSTFSSAQPFLTLTRARPLRFITGLSMKTATLRSQTTSATTLAFRRRSDLNNPSSRTLGPMMTTAAHANINSFEGLTRPPPISLDLSDMTIDSSTP
ncbi:hypothetical protein PQX77_013160 [Marasmius sp. AFHP31]|nr:hypothetical protein PQX77_013160 [Marasmius sp. AFHP31]